MLLCDTLVHIFWILFNESGKYLLYELYSRCLHSAPELKSALIQYPPPVRSNAVDQSSHSLAVATRELFNDLDKNVKPVAPMRFLTVCILASIFFKNIFIAQIVVRSTYKHTEFWILMNVSWFQSCFYAWNLFI